MNDKIKRLGDELNEVRAQMDVLRAKHPGTTMPEDARAEDARLVDRSQRLMQAIEEEKQRDRDAVRAQTASYLDDPQYQVPRAVNADDEGKRIMAKAGWETKNGMVMRMTALGREIAFCPEEVLFGPLPQGHTDRERETARYFNQIRHIMQPEYRDAYVKWIRNTSRSDSLAFAQLSTREQNALSEGQDDSGGFLVPPDVQAEILVRVPQSSVMSQLARTVPTSRDRLEFPAVAPNASDEHVYSSGFVGDWVGETPDQDDIDPAFQQFVIGVRKLRARTKLSNDWLSDAAANMLAFMAENGAENMGLVRDKGFIAGSGSEFMPRGLINAGLPTVDVEGSTTDTISNTTSSPGSSPKITNLIYALPSQYAAGAKWLMTRGSEGKVRQLVDGNGRPIWLSYNQGGLEASPDNIGGYPVLNSEYVPSDGADGNKVFIFGNFSNYIIAQRAAISTIVQRELYSNRDQTGIVLFERVGGGVWNTDAFRVGIV